MRVFNAKPNQHRICASGWLTFPFSTQAEAHNRL
jgi:hypothetical protein